MSDDDARLEHMHDKVEEMVENGIEKRIKKEGFLFTSKKHNVMRLVYSSERYFVKHFAQGAAEVTSVDVKSRVSCDCSNYIENMKDKAENVFRGWKSAPNECDEEEKAIIESKEKQTEVLEKQAAIITLCYDQVYQELVMTTLAQFKARAPLFKTAPIEVMRSHFIGGNVFQSASTHHCFTRGRYATSPKLGVDRHRLHLFYGPYAIAIEIQRGNGAALEDAMQFYFHREAMSNGGLGDRQRKSMFNTVDEIMKILKALQYAGNQSFAERFDLDNNCHTIAHLDSLQNKLFKLFRTFHPEYMVDGKGSLRTKFLALELKKLAGDQNTMVPWELIEDVTAWEDGSG